LSNRRELTLRLNAFGVVDLCTQANLRCALRSRPHVRAGMPPFPRSVAIRRSFRHMVVVIISTARSLLLRCGRPLRALVDVKKTMCDITCSRES
jgi:hypothetical protein